jgi:hypothetical protein
MGELENTGTETDGRATTGVTAWRCTVERPTANAAIAKTMTAKNTLAARTQPVHDVVAVGVRIEVEVDVMDRSFGSRDPVGGRPSRCRLAPEGHDEP